MNEETQTETQQNKPLNPSAKGFRHGCFGGCITLITGWFTVNFIIGVVVVNKMQMGGDQAEAASIGGQIGGVGYPIVLIGTVLAAYYFYKRAMKEP